MTGYVHSVKYYETDKMGITHHSNYIHWMEEARVDYLRQIGFPYEKLEEMGIASPVVSVECKYKAPTTFPDEVQITVSVEGFNGLRLRFLYEMRKGDQFVAVGHSEHCFVDGSGKLLRLKRDYPALYGRLLSLLPSDRASDEASIPEGGNGK